jgi:hypothetical protein
MNPKAPKICKIIPFDFVHHPGLELPQPGCLIDRNSILFSAFYLKTEAKSSFQNVPVLLFYNSDDRIIILHFITDSLSHEDHAQVPLHDRKPCQLMQDSCMEKLKLSS